MRPRPVDERASAPHRSACRGTGVVPRQRIFSRVRHTEEFRSRLDPTGEIASSQARPDRSDSKIRDRSDLVVTALHTNAALAGGVRKTERSSDAEHIPKGGRGARTPQSAPVVREPSQPLRNGGGACRARTGREGRAGQTMDLAALAEARPSHRRRRAGGVVNFVAQKAPMGTRGLAVGERGPTSRATAAS